MLEGLEQFVAREELDVLGAPVLGRHAEVIGERAVCLRDGVVELEAFEDESSGAGRRAGWELGVDRPPDGPDGAGASLDPDHDPFRGTAVVDTVDDSFREHARGLAAHSWIIEGPGRSTTIGLVGKLGDFFRNPFAALFSREGGQLDRLATYVIREHERGRSLDEILDDPYIRNRTSPEQRARLLDNPIVVRALGESVVERERERL